MNWIPYPEYKPNESKQYLVSISGPYANGDITFSYIAFYNANTDEWFKYNPFEENTNGEKINLKINGWSNDLTTFIR